MPTMTKIEALNVFHNVSRKNGQPTEREWRSLLRALDALGLDPEEQRKAARMLDVVDSDGKPYVEGVTVPWTIDAPV